MPDARRSEGLDRQTVIAGLVVVLGSITIIQNLSKYMAQ